MKPMRILLSLGAAAFLAAALAAPASAQGKSGGKGGGKGNDKWQEEQSHGHSSRGNSGHGNSGRGNSDHGHSGHGHSGHGNAYYSFCPPGLAKKGCVPPGQRKKWNVGHRLSRDVRYRTIYQWDRYDLAPPPRGHFYGYVDNDILLIEAATRLVVDAVVRGILLN